MFRPSLILLFTLALTLLNAATHALATTENPVATPAIIDLSAINAKIDPCDDFYHYACGNWIDGFTLPGDKSSYYRQFSGLEDQANEALNEILKAYAKSDFTINTKNAQKLGDLYTSCMDEAAIDKASAPILRDLFRKVDTAKSPDKFAETLAELHLMGVGALFNFYASSDLNDSTKVIGYADQGGIGLPDQSYYVKTDKKSKDLLTQYERHIARTLHLLGQSKMHARANAKFILGFETQLAKSAMTLADRMDSSKTNHFSDRAGLANTVSNIKWDTYFKALGATSVEAINLSDPTFLGDLNKLLATTPAGKIRLYLKWQIVLGFATEISKALSAEHFDFFTKTLKGQKVQEARWETCTKMIEGTMSEALGEAYVSQLSADAIRAETESMFAAIGDVFAADVQALDWLDAPTKALAIAKLKTLGKKIAFPDHWRNYDELAIKASGLLENTIQTSIFESHRNLNKIGKPVDRSEWYMAPWEANAYYDPSLNEMVLPIGELIPPILDLTASTGANYGSLGATTIGHELIHGFDSNGSQFDENGNFKDWWAPQVKKDFETRTACLVKQANAYEILPGLFINGEATITENIADQGGARIGFNAYKKIAGTRPPAAKVGAFAEDQQFFLSQAQAWCAKRSEASLRLIVGSNEHPPEEFRVNGVVKNLPEFAESFGCKAGSKMAPVERCSIW